MKLIPKSKVPDEKKHVLSITVTIGPATTTGTTRRQLVEDLRREAKKHPKSFIKQMYEHFAEHIEDAAKHDPTYDLDGPFKNPFNVTYYGEGSCSACTSGYCCICAYDGHSWCEDC